ncbi:MAG: putative lipid II flippase FtsW [Candidatus Omnitrophica bacterium]|nr:putative lipid II flippase FtsW [Candidatus Omnitrophota bacterium]
MSKEARILFVTVYLLLGLGVVMTYSSSAMYAEYLYRNSLYFLIRQISFAAIGTLLMFAVFAVAPRFWKEHSRAMMFMAIVFLLLVFVPVVGHSAGGARRWIWLGVMNFQPVEFAKVAVCVYLSDYLARKRKSIHRGSLGVFFPPLLLLGIVCALTLLQPDLGSTVFIFLLASILFFLAGIHLRYVIAALAIMLPVFTLLIIKFPYRLSRVTAFLNPWDDPQGSGFQIIQSLYAFALGGFKGVGLGESTQKLFYLPSSYNDFIFSIIGEELGLLGIAGVMGLYITIFVCGILMAEKASTDYEKFLIISLTLLIVLQAVIHMMVATGLVPTKGLPLPFVSYGGTSLVFNLIAVGLLLGITRKS